MTISFDKDNGYIEQKELEDVIGYDPSLRALIALWRKVISLSVKYIKQQIKDRKKAPCA